MDFKICWFNNCRCCNTTSVPGTVLKGTGTEQAHAHVHNHGGGRQFAAACFSSGMMNDSYVECNFALLCPENKGWREWVIRSLRSLLSVRGKYIHLIGTSCSLLSNHSLISHTTHPCHNLRSSLTFITPFCNLSSPLSLSVAVWVFAISGLHPSAPAETWEVCLTTEYMMKCVQRPQTITLKRSGGIWEKGLMSRNNKLNGTYNLAQSLSTVVGFLSFV